MDRLLVVTPREVRLNFETGKKVFAKIRLHNLMHTMPVAFKVLTTAPRKYSVHPEAVIIPPRGEHLLEVVMTAQKNFPECFPFSADKLYIKSLMVPTGKATEAELNLWFSTRRKHVFNDASLKVVFTGSQILWRLAASGSWESVKEVLRDTDVNAKDGQDRTAVYIAAVQGNYGAMKALIEGGAKLNVKNKTGQTPLFEAALAGHSEIVKILLSAAADTEAKNSRCWTPLHAAAAWNQGEIVRSLLEAGSDKNATADKGKTPLHEAAMAGHVKTVALLVQSGADIEKICFDGSTALHIAASSGFQDVVELLLEAGANRDVRNHKGKTPRDLAFENEHNQLLDSLHLQQMVQKAARKNDVGTVNDCLILGASTEGRDQHGWTALHRASFKGHLDTVKMLLKHKLNVNSKDDEGYTPLHCAVETGQKEVVDLLLQHGADINARINKGSTPLALALTMKYLGIIKLLEEKKPGRNVYEKKTSVEM